MDTKKLRQKILDLAIRGKLVPQDPNDEPASVLLERIRAEKERLIKEGKIKRSKKSASDDEIEAPFEIPESWEWVTIEEICSKIGSGSTPRGSNYSPNGIPFFRSQNVYNEGLVYDDIKFISEETHKTMIGTEVQKNDLLLNITGGSLGRCAIVPDNFDRGNVSQHVCILRPLLILPGYLHAFIISDYFSSTMILSGSGREGLPKYSLEAMFLPIPPISEQNRIVKEIERWFALIDELESNEDDLMKAIDQAKSKILDLAIHGKLAPQDPKDEPAIDLLKRINPKFVPCDNELDFNQLPDSWEVATFLKVCGNIPSKPYQILQSDIKSSGKIPVISQSANYIEGFSDEEDRILRIDNPILIFGDHTRVLKYVDFDFIVGADGVKIIKTLLPTRFVYYVLMHAIHNMQGKGYARHYAILSKTQIPIPPYQEQLRIVAKVEELFAILDSIKESLE